MARGVGALVAVLVLVACELPVSRVVPPVEMLGERVSSTGPPRAIPSDFLGMNGEGISKDQSGNVWRQNQFRQAAASLAPGNLRIFGGTSSNLWDWRAGRLLRDGPTGSTGYERGHPRTPITVVEFGETAKAAHATGLLSLNVVSATLPDQLAMISAVMATGVDVRRVELGNELWAPGYASVFPDGTAYARVANTWISAIHEKFPGVLVAVPANNPQRATNDRASRWNSQLFAHVRGADAVTLHAYLRTVNASPQEVVNAPRSEWQTVMGDSLDSVPAQFPIWVTEWNYATSGASRELAWPRALGNTQFLLELLRQPRIRLADFHDLVGGQGSGFAAIRVLPAHDPVTGPFAFRLTPSGAALSLLTHVLNGCRRIQLLSVVAPTRGSAAHPSGVACVEGRGRLVIVNPTSSSRTVDVSDTLGDKDVNVKLLTMSPASNADTAVPTAGSVAESGAVALPPWSMISVES